MDENGEPGLQIIRKVYFEKKNRKILAPARVLVDESALRYGTGTCGL